MLCTPDNYQDIARYYRNSYVKFPEAHGDKLFFIDSVDRQYLSGVDEDGNGFEVWYHKEYPANISYVLPHKSFFQHKEYAFLLRRMPARQFMRGLSDQNTMLKYLRHDGALSAYALDFAVLKSYVAKENFKPLNAAFESKNRSEVVAKRFAYVPGKVQSLYLDDVVVAVRTGEKKLSLKYGVFRDEVSALAQGTGIEVI